MDAYLDGELTPGETARFAAHLDTCPACREAVDEQHWIDDLLRTPAIAQLETAPPALAQSFRKARARRLQIRRLVVGAAAAAVLLVAVGWAAKVNRHAVGTRAGVVGASDAVAPDMAEPAATFIGGPDVIAVPIASQSPDVTIVRIYATVPSFAAYPTGANSDSDSSFDERARPEVFNGG
jgi:hypothetical protein